MNYSAAQPESEPLQLRKLQELLLRISLRRMLGETEAENYCLFRWIPLREQRPDDSSYVLIKYLDTDGKAVCSCPASYESGHFRDLFTDDLELVINPAIILGWAYYPYDGR